MKMIIPVSSIFCCAGERQFSLGEEGDAKRLRGPVAQVDRTTGLHCLPNGCGGERGQHCSESQQQLGESATRLLFFQFLEFPKTRLQNLRAPGEPFARLGFAFLASHEFDQFSGQLSAAGSEGIQLRDLSGQRACNAPVNPLAVDQRRFPDDAVETRRFRR